MAHITQDEYLDRFSQQETISLTDPAGVTLDVEKLQTAIDSATAFVNGYLATRYSLPLSTVPEEVKDATADLARERLFTLHPNEEVTARADRWRSWLKDVSRGLVAIVALDARIEEATTDEAVVYAPEQIFTSDLMSAYRGRMQ